MEQLIIYLLILQLNLFIMDLILIVLSLGFLLTSVYFIYKITSRIKDEHALILIIVLLYLTAFIALFIIDVVIFYKAPLLRTTTRDTILQMVQYLLIGVGSIYLYNKYTNNK